MPISLSVAGPVPKRELDEGADLLCSIELCKQLLVTTQFVRHRLSQ